MVGGQAMFYQDRQREVGTAIATCVDAIGSAQALVEEAKASLNVELKEYEAAVKTEFNLDSLAQLLGVLETLSFTPHDPGWQKNAMLASQTFKALNLLSGMGGDFETASGTYKKEYVVHQIEVFGDHVTSLKDAYTIANDRSIALQDPNAYKLLMKREEFENMCDKFYSKTGANSKKAQEAMDYLVEQVQLRNDKIMEYNSLLRQQQDLRSRLESLGLQKRETETKLAANADPGLPEMTAFVDECYEQAKERCLKDLYMASRAYVFWALEPYSLFKDLLEETHPNEIDHTLMLRGKDTILGKLKETRELMAGPLQSFAKIVIHLKDHPGALQTLRSKEMANFYIQPAGTKTSIENSPFAGLADVRITKVRPWAIGLETGETDHKAHLHHLVMTHLGSETVVTPVGEACSFVHEQVDTTVIYDSAAIGKDEAFTQRGSEDGTLDDPEGKADFSQIGPFGKWRISILKKHNIGLKLDTLQDVEIEFYRQQPHLEGWPSLRMHVSAKKERNFMADHIVPPPDHITPPDHTTHPDHTTGEPDLHFYEPEPGEPRPHSYRPPPDVPEPGLPSNGPRDPVIGPHYAPPVIEPLYDPDSVLSFLADPSRKRNAVASANGTEPVSIELDGVICSYENAWRIEKEINVERDAPDRLTSLHFYVERAGDTLSDQSVRDRLDALVISLIEYDSRRWSDSHRDMLDSFTRSEFQRFGAETLTKVLKHADQIAREPKARASDGRSNHTSASYSAWPTRSARTSTMPVIISPLSQSGGSKVGRVIASKGLAALRTK